jgi:adenylate kinase family enzyme
MKYLVIGRAGSGKSSVAGELKERGHNALDADKVQGLARWEDAITGHPTSPEDIAYVDSSRFHWNWQTEKMADLLASEESLFLCGGADNDLSFVPSFDQTFVLDVNPKSQTRRLESVQRNQDNPYATHPDMVPIVLAEQADLVNSAIKLGAVAIDANQPLRKVFDEILSHIDEN